MSATAAGSGLSAAEQGFLSPNELHFDLQNPRFPDEKFENELEAIEFLYLNTDVDELIQSIISAGYLDFEPFIVLREVQIVLEGNRRLAALRLIADEGLRRRLKISLPDIDNPKSLPEKVRILWVNSRTAARGYIGFKHINGPFKWDSLAKAKYAAAWLQDGGDIETVSRTLGDNHSTVRRLVNGWFALEQAVEDGFDLNDISKRAFAFSHLYTALTRPSVREMLGLSAEDLSTPPRPHPVPKERREDLQTLMSWLYGQEQKGQPTLIQSQNPNLNQLIKVLGHPEAKHMLLAKRDLQVAYERVEPASDRFEAALMLATKQAEEAMSLSAHYNGDLTLMGVADGLHKTARSLLVVMRDKVDPKPEAE